jgi:hypothetical protein
MSRLLDAADYYRHVFAARTDDYVSWTGTMWTRAGSELTGEAVAAGLDGSGPPLSGYFLTPASEGHVAAIDFDTEDGMKSALRARDLLLRRGAPSYPEPSRRGAHLWVVSDAVLPGRTLRQFLVALLRDAEVPQSDKTEFRPAQDAIRPDGYGAPLRMPTMRSPKTGLRYPVIGLDGRPLPRALDEMMLAVDFAPSWVLESMAATVRPGFRAIRTGDRLPRPRDDEGRGASEILRDLWGMPEPKVGRANHCPAHDDRNPSLSIARDDRRVWCKQASCILANDGRGRGTHELEALAPGRPL